jgi:hypothetical protein
MYSGQHFSQEENVYHKNGSYECKNDMIVAKKTCIKFLLACLSNIQDC